MANTGATSPQPTTPYGPSRDAAGNLRPGWETGELGDQYVGPGYISSSTTVSTQESRRGVQAARNDARSKAVGQTQRSEEQKKDWRVRLSLAENFNYLYKAENPGILKPLAATRGVIFPYTPSISVNYSASYDTQLLTHSNYKIFQYTGSSVDNVNISCDFTAQDTSEANYVLAVIHFLRTVTKMFYGQDKEPAPGTPPPLLYLTGLGEFQFNGHPLVLTSFQYQLPNEVDYIRAGSSTELAGNNLSQFEFKTNTYSTPSSRRAKSGLNSGGNRFAPNFAVTSSSLANSNATYVPTKMTISIGCLPIVSRKDVSNNFSVTDYATGKLMRGNTQAPKRGFW